MDWEDCVMATKAEKAYMNKMSEFGCCVCKWYCEEIDAPPATIHHIRHHTGMGRKDEKMIPLCPYHHQGKMGIHTMGKKTWEERYGTQVELYNRLQEEL